MIKTREKEHHSFHCVDIIVIPHVTVIFFIDLHIDGELIIAIPSTYSVLLTAFLFMAVTHIPWCRPQWPGIGGLLLELTSQSIFSWWASSLSRGSCYWSCFSLLVVLDSLLWVTDLFYRILEVAWCFIHDYSRVVLEWLDFWHLQLIEYWLQMFIVSLWYSIVLCTEQVASRVFEET